MKYASVVQTIPADVLELNLTAFQKSEYKEFIRPVSGSAKPVGHVLMEGHNDIDILIERRSHYCRRRVPHRGNLTLISTSYSQRSKQAT
jgi:hypothetical protein